LQDKQSVLIKPELTEAKSLVDKAFKARNTLIIAGDCQVLYCGRADSKLDFGERILIIKADGALLVHRPVGYEPVNWQPSGSVFHTQIKNDLLEIHGIREKPREHVKIDFKKIFTVTAFNLLDSADFILNASEIDMHKAILLNPSLIEEGFKPISYEKKVEPGFVDVYGTDKDGKLVVVEVKRKTASKEAVVQLAKYIDAIKGKANRELRGILVAPSLGKDVQRMLISLGLEFKALEPKKCAEVLKKSKTAKLEKFFHEN
jgi:endonuclease